MGGAAAKKKSMVPIVLLHKFMCVYIYIYMCVGVELCKIVLRNACVS